MFAAALDIPTKNLTLAVPGAPLIAWLVDCALPLWSVAGVDRGCGGFFEKIDRQGRPVEEPRRARVVARQIYVFATACRRGWLAGADALVDHGLDFLLNRMRLPGGTFAASVRTDGTVVNGTFDLYEQAFVLFALAAASAGRPDRAPVLRCEADALLQCIRDRWAHPLAGFEEADPPSLPLRSNPHMHLLEAAMAWADISEGRVKRTWDDLADELVDLCIDRFIDPASGAVREEFDAAWRPLPDVHHRSVEPGHQFEWAWLLLRRARSDGRARIRTAAWRLLQIGETHGVDPRRGVAVDALDCGLRVGADTARLWPQTERIKAWHAAGLWTAGPSQARDHLDDAVQGLSRYLMPSPAGLWHEQMRPDRTFVAQDCRASSLYHIVCAIDTLAGDGAGVTPSAPA
jgi:mannose-6-phosphate isomerase